MTNVLPDYETRTRNLAAYQLRETAETVDTVVIDRTTGKPYRVAVPTSSPFQEPPTGPVPPLPQPSPNPPPTPAAQTAVIYPRHAYPVMPGMGYEPEAAETSKPLLRRGRRRRATPAWLLVLTGIGAGVPIGAGLLGSVLASLVIR